MSSPFHVVIADSHIHDWGDHYALERAAWEAQGIRLTLAACTSEADIIAAGQDADVLVYLGLYTPFTAHVMANLPRCCMIARYGIGVESVDLAAATAHGILVANAAEFCVTEVAEHTTALLLGRARRIPVLDRLVHAGGWPRIGDVGGPLRRLSTQTLGLVGFGRIARQVARYTAPMMGRIVAFDPFVPPALAAELGVSLVELDDLLAEADYVSVHTPLLPETHGLIGAAQLARMKPSACLINTSRGPVVDQVALIAALQSGQIAAAALDVFDREPLAADSPLRGMDNVILTPHTAATSAEATEDVRAAVIATVSAVAQGRRPRHIVNAGVAPRVALQNA